MMRLLFSSITLFFSSQLYAFDVLPDRVYIPIGSQHYGWPEDLFGVEGPNEQNFGLGLGWRNRNNFDYNLALYKDSYDENSFSMDVKYGIFRTQKLDISAGLSYTKSLEGETVIELSDNRLGLIKERSYISPVFTIESYNTFVHFRAGVDQELNPVAVLGFGFYLDIK